LPKSCSPCGSLCARQAARTPAGWKTLHFHAAQSGERS
jgi:hypothetical protein